MATAKTDVAVVGGGIFGLSCAYACARRGLAVTVVEADRIASGASGGIVGAMSPHVPERWIPKKQFQLEALRAAPDYWATVEDLSGLPTGYGRVGRIMPLPDVAALDLANHRSKGAAALWRGLGEWRIEGVGFAADWLDPKQAGCGVAFDTFSARINPRLACLALAEAARRCGAEIVEGWPVARVSDRGVAGPMGDITCDRVILAAGVPGFEILEQMLGQKAGAGVKGQSALFDLNLPADTPTIFANGVYIVAHSGGGVAVGSTSENSWDDPTTTDAQLDAVIARARVMCPALRDIEPIEYWAGLRPKARCRDTMLGPIPGFEKVFVATGAFKIGFGISNKVGEALADLVTGQPTFLPPSFTVESHLTGK